MVFKIRRHSMDSAKIESMKVEVGEIDTTAPFESVKAAVSLFGEKAVIGPRGNSASNKSKPPSVENVLAKETQLHLAQKELNKLKEQLENADTTKAQALAELENAKRTVEDLTNKLRTINESKELANKATKAAKDQVKQLDEANSGEPSGLGGAWEEELHKAREQYADIVSAVDAAKQELRKIRQDLEASKEAKAAACQQTIEAVHSAKANTEKAGEISKEIASTHETLVNIKFASARAQQEQAKALSENDAQRQSVMAVLEEKLESLKKEIVPELTGDLEGKLAATSAEIGALEKEIKHSKASDINSMEDMSTEIDNAKEALEKLVQDKTSLSSLVESLKLELESVKKEHSELKEKEWEIESLAASLHVEVQKSKAELEVALAEAKAACQEELVKTLEQLSSESATARQEAEEMNKTAEELKKEADTNRISLEEATRKLEALLKETGEAKKAETEALDRIKILSDRTNAARASTSESGSNITISTEEFESLKRKVEECEKLAKMKEDAAIAQVEAVKASENEALRKVETSRKEIDEMKAAAEEALKSAEMAEAAKNAIEGELKKWGEREQKKVAESATLIEPELSSELSPHDTTEKKEGSRKMEKKFGSKKFLPSIFQRKKSNVGVGSPRLSRDKSV